MNPNTGPSMLPGYALRQLRLKAGWNITTAAFRAGCSTALIHAMEHDKGCAAQGRQEAYADLLTLAAQKRAERLHS